MSARSRRQTRRRRVSHGTDPFQHNLAVAAEKDLRRLESAYTAPTPASMPTCDIIPYYNRDGRRIRMEEWQDLCGDRDYIRIGLDRIGQNLVSTVWVGLDHGWGQARRPIIFETMIIEGPHNGFQQRYSTEDAARCGHMEVVEAILEGSAP